MFKSFKHGFKILISSIFYGYARNMIKNENFEVGHKYIKKSYKWSPSIYTELTTKMLEGVLLKKEGKQPEANLILIFVTDSLQKSNKYYENDIGFEKNLSEFESVFGVIKNKMKKEEENNK